MPTLTCRCIDIDVWAQTKSTITEVFHCGQLAWKLFNDITNFSEVSLRSEYKRRNAVPVIAKQNRTQSLIPCYGNGRA